MTAAFDASRGTDQRFTDALSGSDGTADPSVMMPVLDVYPDALSAPMPLDVIPVVIPMASSMAQAGVRAEPVVGPAGRGPGRRLPDPQRQPAQRQPAQRQATPRQATPRQATQRQPAARQPVVRPQPVASSMNTIPPRPPVQAYRPIMQTPPAAPPQQGHALSWQGWSMTPSDIAAMVRAGLQGQSGQLNQQSFQSTHPQSMGSAAPQAVAPAAPMASQYSGRGQARNDAREQSQERRRTAVPGKKRSSSAVAVLFFLFVILFASGLGEKIIDFVMGLLNP